MKKHFGAYLNRFVFMLLLASILPMAPSTKECENITNSVIAAVAYVLTTIVMLPYLTRQYALSMTDLGRENERLRAKIRTDVSLIRRHGALQANYDNARRTITALRERLGDNSLLDFNISSSDSEGDSAAALAPAPVARAIALRPGAVRLKIGRLSVPAARP